MKSKPNRFLATSFVAVAALSSSAFAQTTWSGATDGSWATGTNWSAGIPDNLDLVTYGAGTGVGIAVTNPTQTLDASREVLGFAVGNNAASPIVINSGTGSNTLTIGTSGILLNSATGGNFTSNADIIMAGAQSFTTGTARSITANNVANGGFLLTVNTAGTTSTTAIGGELSGTGGLTKSGPGTLTLSGTANTFGGQVTLGGGTTSITKLATIGNNSSLGTGNGASSLVINGGTLTYTGAGGDTTDRAIDMRAASVINNNSGTGAITFTAANVIQGGSATARTLTLGGSNAGDNTFSSILGDSGSGANISSLQKNGAGKWIVTGTQLYTGATIINQGTLSVSGSTVLGGATGSTVDAGNIVFGQNLNSGALHFETVANLGAADQIRFRNTGGTVGSGGALIYTGTTNQTLSKTLQSDSSIGIRIESNSVGGSLTFNGAFSQSNRPLFLGGTGTGDNTLATGFSGSGGITKRDDGTWVLSTANTYTGATNVTGGTLAIGASGSLANTTTTISLDGTLAGGGTIGGTTTIFGTHTPGFSPGTQTFTNGLSYADSATLVWDLIDNTTGGRGTNYDAVNVTGGSFALATGATIDLAFSGSVDFLHAFWGMDQEWLVVDLSGSATAADSNLFTIGSITGGANWDPTLGSFGILRKDGSTAEDSVYLTWAAIPEPTTALLGGIGMLLLLRRRR